MDPVESADGEDVDIYEDLGDLESNDLMQFAYQIATGMVCSVLMQIRFL